MTHNNNNNTSVIYSSVVTKMYCAVCNLCISQICVNVYLLIILQKNRDKICTVYCIAFRTVKL